MVADSDRVVSDAVQDPVVPDVETAQPGGTEGKGLGWLLSAARALALTSRHDTARWEVAGAGVAASARGSASFFALTGSPSAVRTWSWLAAGAGGVPAYRRLVLATMTERRLSCHDP